MLTRIGLLSAGDDANGPPLRAEATITRRASGRLQLRLVVHEAGTDGERIIEGRACEDLAGAAAITLALSLKAAKREPPVTAEVVSVGAGASSAGASKPAAAPEEAEAVVSVPAHNAAATRRWRALLQVPLGTLSFGPLPAPAVGVALAAGAWLPPWRLLIDGSYWLRQDLMSAEHAASGASLDRLGVGASLCLAFPIGSLELSPCARIGVEHVRAHGTGLHVVGRTAVATWLAPGVGAQGRLRVLDWLGVVATVDVALELARPRIAIDGLGTIERLGPAALRMGLGAELIF